MLPNFSQIWNKISPTHCDKILIKYLSVDVKHLIFDNWKIIGIIIGKQISGHLQVAEISKLAIKGMKSLATKASCLFNSVCWH